MASLLHSRSPIIPAVLSHTVQEFMDKLEFARTVGSVHLDVIDQDLVQGAALSIEDWPKQINVEYAEAHLMVRRPLEYLEKLAERGVGRAIVHVEADFNAEELLQKARELDILIGYAVKPDTDLLTIKPLLSTNAYIQLMGVQPGMANQQLIESTPLAVTYIHKSTSRQIFISVDGGIRLSNIPDLKRAGANYFASSNAIFGTPNWQENYDQLVQAATGGSQ